MDSTSIPTKATLGIVVRGLSHFILLGILTAGCVAPNKQIAAPTQPDRLIQAYPEIQNGRLLILADFEDEKQMDIFQLESATNPGRLARDPKKGRPETGIAALAVALSAPNESVVIANSDHGQWSLQRDWRPYDLLMMAVNSPVAGLNLEIKIIGGVSGHAVEARTESVLSAGWNMLRFDLLEIGEQVPLDDIQEIRLAVMNPPVPPSTLYFDDFLLVGNRRDLMGDSANQTAGLYVQSAGRHWNVGAAGRFEISFRNGQIARWFNLAADPYRLRNLVRGTSLGPVPVLTGGSAAVNSATSLRGALSARQRILEMNAVRVVIESLWQSDSQAAGTPAAFEHWVYTIYPTGQIFVSATTSGTPDGTSSQPSMAVNMAWSPTAPSVQIVPSDAGQSGNNVLPNAAYALARSPDADSALLFIPYSDAGPTQLKEMSDATTRTISLIWSKRHRRAFANLALSVAARTRGLTRPGRGHRPRNRLHAIWLGANRGPPQAGPMLRADGFDPATGCFRVATDGNRARIVVDGKKRPAFSPAFQVDGRSTDQAWVYVNYLVHHSVVRDPRGEVLFQLPGSVLKEIVVEPLFKNSPGLRP